MPSNPDPQHPPPPPAAAGAHPPPPPKPNQKFLSLILKALIMTFITTLFFLFLGVAAILLLIATAAFHRHSNPPNSSSSSAAAAAGGSLSSDDLKKLPQFRFAKRMTTTTAEESEIECVVCLDGIKQGQWCRKLCGCGHVFHRRCVDAWLVKVPACPICRGRVRLDSGGSGLERAVVAGFDWRSEWRVW